MKCPNCRLENPPSTQRCDCGYDFVSNEIKESYLTEIKQQFGFKNKLLKIFFIIIGIIIARIITYLFGIIGLMIYLVAGYYIITHYEKKQENTKDEKRPI